MRLIKGESYLYRKTLGAGHLQPDGSVRLVYLGQRNNHLVFEGRVREDIFLPLDAELEHMPGHSDDEITYTDPTCPTGKCPNRLCSHPTWAKTNHLPIKKEEQE